MHRKSKRLHVRAQHSRTSLLPPHQKVLKLHRLVPSRNREQTQGKANEAPTLSLDHVHDFCRCLRSAAHLAGSSQNVPGSLSRRTPRPSCHSRSFCRLLRTARGASGSLGRPEGAAGLRAAALPGSPLRRECVPTQRAQPSLSCCAGPAPRVLCLKSVL